MKLTKAGIMKRLTTGMVEGQAYRQNSIPMERLSRPIKVY